MPQTRLHRQAAAWEDKYPSLKPRDEAGMKQNGSQRCVQGQPHNLPRWLIWLEWRPKYVVTLPPPAVATVVWGGIVWLTASPKAAVLGPLQKPSNRSTHQLQTARKHGALSEVQLFHGGSCQWSVCIKMLSPWETPLKLSLYVIYTENKPRAKNHRERLFKHNSHGPWKMIKAGFLIVHVPFLFLRIS